MNEYWGALLGGALIGTSATIMLGLHGRITGMSGILSLALTPGTPRHERLWRAVFLLGLLLAGLVFAHWMPEQFGQTQARPLTLIGAGLLVGFGTRLGSGCTSGHGVCGLSRLSKRSLVATLVFMAFGIWSARTFGVHS